MSDHDANEQLPHVTHEGRVTICGVELVCYQLSDGNRVFEAESFNQFVGAVFGENTVVPATKDIDGVARLIHGMDMKPVAYKVLK